MLNTIASKARSRWPSADEALIEKFTKLQLNFNFAPPKEQMRIEPKLKATLASLWETASNGG